MLINNSREAILNEILVLSPVKHKNKDLINTFLDILDIYDLLNPYYTALHLHEGQFRKYSKEAYINHPVRVCLNAYSALYTFNCHKAFYNSEDIQNVLFSCLLHDVLEDTDAIPSLLLEQGIDSSVLYTVNRLTKNKFYNERLRESNAIVKLVKLADIEDNLECNVSKLSKKQLVKRLAYLQEKSEQINCLKHKNLIRYCNYLKTKIKEQRKEIQTLLDNKNIYLRTYEYLLLK